MKKILSICLILSMVFTTQGFYTFAESVDTIIENQTDTQEAKTEEKENIVEEVDSKEKETQEITTTEQVQETDTTNENIVENTQDTTTNDDSSNSSNSENSESSMESSESSETSTIQETISYLETLTDEQKEELVEETTTFAETTIKDYLNEVFQFEPTAEETIKTQDETEPEEDLKDVQINENEEIATNSEIEDDETVNNTNEEEPEYEEIATESEVELIEIVDENEAENDNIATESEIVEENIEIASESEIMVMSLDEFELATISNIDLLGSSNINNTLMGASTITWDTSHTYVDLYVYKKDIGSKIYYMTSIEPTDYAISGLNKLVYRYGHAKGVTGYNFYDPDNNTITIDSNCELTIETDLHSSTYIMKGESTDTNPTTVPYKSIFSLFSKLNDPQTAINHIKIDNVVDNSIKGLFAGIKFSNVTELDLTSWDVSSITNMEGLFANSNLKTINITGWDMTNVSSAKKMFLNCSNLQKIYVDPDTWTTDSITESTNMMYGINNIKGQYNNSYINTIENDKTKAFISQTDKTGYLSTLKRYDVIFDTENKAEVASQSILWGTKAINPGNPTNPDAKFYKWTADENATLDSAEYDFNTLIYQDTTIYAVWNSIYNVQFNNMGHGGSTPTTQRIENGKKATNPGNLSETGWTFDGWYKDGALTNKFNFDQDVITGETTLYAKWIENIYKVTFVRNGGIWSDNRLDIATRSYTEEMQLPAQGGITKEGYTFDAWYENNQFAANTKIATIPSNTARDITIYAKWVENTYKIYYNFNGGSLKNDLKIENYNLRLYSVSKNFPNSKEVEKRGYNFLGWYESTASDTTYISQTEKNTTKEYFVNAKWDLAKYSLNIYCKGGDWIAPYSMEFSLTRSIKENTVVILPTIEQIKKDGNTFKGWYDNENYTGNVWTRVDDGTLENKSFYAKWEPNTYNIIYHLNIGSTSNVGKIRTGEVGSYKYGTPVTLTTDVIYDGYIFDGWYTAAGVKKQTISATDIGNIDLYSHWKAVPIYNISFDSNGGTGSMENIKQTHGVYIIIPKNSFYKNRYSFSGWKDKEGKTYTVGEQATPNKDLTLYAQWTYVGGGSSGGSGGGGGGGGSSSGGTISPTSINGNSSSSVKQDTQAEVLQKIANMPVLPGKYKIIKSDGRGSYSYDASLETSTSKWTWVKTKDGHYIMVNNAVTNKTLNDYLSGFNLIELNGVYQVYHFNTATNYMDVGFIAEGTTGKIYFFETDTTKTTYGAMVRNETRTVNGITFSMDANGVVTFGEPKTNNTTTTATTTIKVEDNKQTETTVAETEKKIDTLGSKVLDEQYVAETKKEKASVIVAKSE